MRTRLATRIFLRTVVLITVLVLVTSGALAVFAVRVHRGNVKAWLLAEAKIHAVEVERILRAGSIEALGNLLGAIDSQPGFEYAFVTRAGRLYVRAPHGGIPREFLSVHPGKWVPIREFRDERGRLLYAVTVPVEGTDAVLHLGVLRDAGDRGIYPLLRLFAAISGVVLLGGVALSVVFARWTTREVSRLTRDLHASEERFRALFEAARDCIFVKDTRLRYKFVNPAVERILGRSASEIIGRTASEFLEPKVAERMREEDLKVLRGEAVREELPLVVNGQSRVFDVVKVPVRGPDGVIAGLCGIARDVTAHSRLELQLQRVQRMKAVGELAGGLAHEFNNLLQVIQGYGELALQRVDSGALPRDYLVRVVKAASRAASLTRELLAFSRRQVMQMRRLDLNRLVGDFMEVLKPLVGERIEVRFIPRAVHSVVWVDPRQFDQVLVNLCLNARDAMPEGGRLTIETHDVFFDDAYCVDHPEFKPVRYVELVVSDTGCGMDEETRGRVFDPFFTTKEVGKGTGLGLAAVHGVVKQHDGIIQVGSEKGRGTTFKIYLPIVDGAAVGTGEDDEEAEAEVEAEPAEPMAGCGGETILIVEDDDMVREVATSILRGAGYRVLEARDGRQALELFRGNRGSIDLVITDAVMPGMDGGEFVAELEREGCNLPVLFSTGYGKQVVSEEFLVRPDVSLIEKPGQPAELLERVREMLDAGRYDACAAD